MNTTHQMNVWRGEFGQAYTSRNLLSVQQLDELYASQYGESRTSMNTRFLQQVPRTSRILEIGTNVGNQLECLQRMGFTRVYGVELQFEAASFAARRLDGARISQGSASQIPFRSATFDLVFTAGVLIHIAPEDLASALTEVHRVSRRFIWGMEYFSETSREIPYRDHTGLLWSNDFAKAYRELFPNLSPVQEEKFPYLDDQRKVDAMFLLEKSS